MATGNESLPDAKLLSAPSKDDTSEPPQFSGGNKRSRSVGSLTEVAAHFLVARNNCLNLRNRENHYFENNNALLDGVSNQRLLEQVHKHDLILIGLRQRNGGVKAQLLLQLLY